MNFTKTLMATLAVVMPAGLATAQGQLANDMVLVSWAVRIKNRSTEPM